MGKFSSSLSKYGPPMLSLSLPPHFPAELVVCVVDVVEISSDLDVTALMGRLMVCVNSQLEYLSYCVNILSSPALYHIPFVILAVSGKKVLS